ncbi:MAG: (d)CMP kinase [Oscillospiraceae bacterium]|nr:(d)CMP kinase [Oscillospiraceae bacterium]
MSSLSFDVVVVGGGAAGCLAAGTAASYGKKVCIIEKNGILAKKVLITGKGRCNVTNNCSDQEFFDNVKTGAKFLHSAISRFSTHDCMEFFESLSVPLKTERGFRVFPVSDKASDIADALKKYTEQNGVAVIHSAVSEICTKNKKASGVKLKNGDFIKSDKIIIATGGKSYPKTGSTGDGYRFAETLGHTVSPIRPALVPLESSDLFCTELTGLSLKNVTLSLVDTADSKVVFSELGEMLFTHFGLSGPLVLSASSHMTGNPSDYYISIDLKPGLSAEKLDARILRDFSSFLNKDISNALFMLLPKSIIPVILEKAGIPKNTKVNSITKEMRAALVFAIKNFKVKITSFRPIEEAIITSGGVELKEIDPKTMESKLVKGIYFAGEVLNADAYTGGFNLQIAFSTGFAAGTAAGAKTICVKERYGMKSVAIDGPAGAGKSVLSKRAAQELGFIYVDTGALYRAVGLYMIEKGIDTKNSFDVANALSEITVDMKYIDGKQTVLLNGEDVGGKLRTPEVSMAASNVSAIPKVRTFLFDMQRSIAKKENVIMDGRDIGTVVLPDADLKIFLTASPEERARRRYLELLQNGSTTDYETVLSEVKLRDYNDSHRPIAPLKKADDAIVIDTTDLNLEQSFELLLSTIKNTLKIY